jgi:DNA-binding MarR family transcriptional regulator
MVDTSIMDISMTSKLSAPLTDLHILEEFGRCRRALNLHFGNALRPLGLGSKQGSLLRFLSKRGKACLADLSRDTQTDPAAMTKIVNLLLKEKLVRQGEHPTDKRRWVLVLTPQGEKLAAEVEKIYQALSEGVLEVLGPGDKSHFLKTLQKITLHLSGEKQSAVSVHK